MSCASPLVPREHMEIQLYVQSGDAATLMESVLRNKIHSAREMGAEAVISPAYRYRANGCLRDVVGSCSSRVHGLRLHG